MADACLKCGAAMEAGGASATGLMGELAAEPNQPRAFFFIPGMPTSTNAPTAFQQGRTEEPDVRRYAIRGQRCTRCGFLELYGSDPI